MYVCMYLYNIFRYKEVISACSLDKDLDIFPHGDQTEVSFTNTFIFITRLQAPSRS